MNNLKKTTEKTVNFLTELIKKQLPELNKMKDKSVRG